MKLYDLKQLLYETEPAAVLVPPLIMARVIQQVAKLPNYLIEVPHRKCFVLARHILFRHVEQEELDLESDRLLPATVILLSRPSPEKLAAMDRDNVLLTYWRRLFHAGVHVALEKAVAEGLLTAEIVRERVAEIGETEFREIRSVLDHDSFLLPPADELGVYVEFASVYLELRYFMPNLRPVYFPAIQDFTRIDAVLARDLDADALFQRTRLPEAPAPVVRADDNSDEPDVFYWKLMRRAEQVARSGNTVRAAILRTQAARVAPADLTASTRAQAQADLQRLTARLQAALHLNDVEAQEWLKDLPALLEKADQGNWAVEARLLYDLQQVCIDHERDIYTLDLSEWVMSGGKRPVKRPLPSQRVVRITKHLRAAQRRLTMARILDSDRHHLAQLLQTSLARSEARLRERFRPLLASAFADVGLQPTSPPEHTAHHKLTEELLDRITDTGFFTFSDLRDAISRNQLKLQDLSDPHQFWRGDPLLRLDRRLATLMDGVYRPAEFYLRWLQRLTSLGFGTSLGRHVTRNLLIPFGAALLLVLTYQIVLHKLHLTTPGPHAPTATATRPEPSKAEAASEKKAEPDAEAAKQEPEPVGPPEPPKQPAEVAATVKPETAEAEQLSLHEFASKPVWGQFSVPLVGLFLLALLHSAGLRETCRIVARGAWVTLRYVFYHVPKQLAEVPWLRALFASWPALLFYWYGFRPLLLCAPLWWFIPATREPVAAVLAFLVVNFLINSRPGLAVNEALSAGVVRAYQWLRAGLLPGLIRLTMDVFKQILDLLEKLLFTVDEWLRFRSGDSRFSMVLRSVLGVLWFPVSYLIRFYIVVLIEPGYNPLKAPVSYLAGKVLMPVWLALTASLRDGVADWHPLAQAPALAVGLFTIFHLMDVFGFLFWEMKENWKLYQANRPAQLRPSAIGSHGETLVRLLHPGFHSGTVPKLFAKLRQAERDAWESADWSAARRHRHALREVEESLRQFVQRELVLLLEQSRAWQGAPLRVGEVWLASNRVQMEVVHGTWPAEPLRLVFEDHAGWLLARIGVPGWLGYLSATQLPALTTALAGLYKRAGVQLVDEQLRAGLPPGVTGYAVTEHGLVLWLDAQRQRAAIYNLTSRRALLRPRTSEGKHADGAPLLDAGQLVFARQSLTWEAWVATWRKDQEGQGHPALFGPATVLLLPPVSSPPAVARDQVATDAWAAAPPA